MKNTPIIGFKPGLLCRLTAGSLFAGALAAPCHAADRWWDGGTTDITTTGDGTSGGNAGTWNSSLLNWDHGKNLAHAAWNNSGNDSALFSGTAGTVTLGGAVSANALAFTHTSGTYTVTSTTYAITLAGTAPRLSSNGTVTISPTVVNGTAGVTKSGGGTLTLRGTSPHGLTGGIAVNGGILEIDFTSLATPTNALDSGNGLTLGGGTFRIKGKSTGTSSQTLNGVTLAGGASGISVTSNGGTGNLVLGAIARDPGAAVNFTLPALGSITTSTGNTRGILGTWASAGSGTSLKYATYSSGAVAALTGTAAATGAALTDTTGAVNYDLAASGGTVPASVSANTIRYTGAAGTTAPGATLFEANGLLNAGSGLWTIGTGSVTIGADRELVIHPGTNGITLSGVVKDHSSGASSLVVSGIGGGALTLGPSNTYTGGTVLNGTSAYADSGKTVVVTALKNGVVNSEFGTSSVIKLNGAVIQTGATGASDRTLQLTGTSGVYIKGSYTQTLAGTLTGGGNFSVDGDFNSGVAGGSGNLVLAGANDFTGDLIFRNDSRITVAHANALANATLDMTGTRILADLATHNLDYVIGGLKGNVDLNLGSGTVSIGGNHQNTIYSGVLSGTADLVKTGNGTLVLTGTNTYTGSTTVSAGVLAVGGSSLADTARLVINGGKVAATGIELVDTLYFGAVQQASGTWGATGSGADHIDDSRFAGTAGVVKVQPWSVGVSTLAFGDVTTGDSINLSVTLTNLGSGSISGSASVSGAPFAVVSGASWSAPGSGTATVTLSFHPTATGSFPDTLTLTGNGITRTVSLSGNGVVFAAPSPSGTKAYSLDLLAGMAVPAASPSISLPQGAILTQSFIPRRDGFLASYAARDSAAPTTTQLKTVTIMTSGAQSTESTVRFEVLRIESGGARTVIATQDFQQRFYSTTYTFTFTSPATLNFDTAYELRLTHVVSGGGVSLFAPSSNYADGSLSTSGDLWLDLGGAATIPVYSQLTLAGDAANRFFLDGDPASADSSSYEYLFGKLLGIGGVADKVNFTHPASWGPLGFEIQNTAIATKAAAGRSGTVDTLALSGVAEGATFLWVKVGSTVVGCVKQQVYPQRAVKLSYTYVQFPGESNHALKTPAMASAVQAYISGIYAKANVAIAWKDNGVLTHEWDKNGDGNSYAPDYNEVWSPIDDGVIPDQTSVYSNVFLLRNDKNDATVAGSGGGTSRGWGEIPPPANGALKRCALNDDAVSIGSTLSHEVGHNCGLAHTSLANNMMAVGGTVDNVAGWQWDIIHATLQSLPAAIRGPVIDSAPVPPSGMAGVSYSHTFTANGGTPGYTWALESGSLPAGLALSGATLSGTPGLAGTYNFTLRITDSTAAYTTASFSISVGAAPPNGPPAFTTDPINLAATEDTAASGQLSATDPESAGTALTYTKISGPAWLSVSSTGALSGTPANANVGSNAFVVRVTDPGGLYDEAALNITVANVNDLPVFAADPINLSATEDAAFSDQLSASDVDAGDTLTFSKISGPAWLSVSGSGALSGTPANANVGANAFVVRVTDAAGGWVNAALNITVANVNDAPAFAADPINVGATEDAAFSGQLSASDVDAGDTLTFSKISGPAWLSVSGSGALSGTPANANVGVNAFVVRVTDAAGAWVNAALNITVANVNDAPAFAADPINLNGTEDTAFSGQLVASDIDAGDAITYSKVSGPAWLTVSSSGALSGTPSNSEVGANNFVVRVTDVAGAYDEAALVITVANVNDAPVFTVDPIVTADAWIGTAYAGQSLAGLATDVDAGDSVTYTKVSGPSWLTVASNGALSGTPPSGSTGLNSFVVRASDGSAATDDAELRITVGLLPLPWASQDIGSGMLAGSATYGSGTFTMNGAGAVSGTSDKLHFTWQELSGDGEIIARVTSLQDTGSFTRVGVMIRESLAANSAHVFMGMGGTGDYRWLRRTSTGGGTTSTTSGTGTVPNTWVRIVRSGNTLSGYKSSNGTSWTLVGSNTVTMATNCYIGLVVASGLDTTLNTSQFSNVSVTP